MDNVTKKGRTILNSELKSMNEEVIQIEQMVNVAMLKAQRALEDGDVGIAKQIIEEDDVLNKKCLELEKHAYRVIALQQPISTDLRQIVSIIRIIPDLERMGDHVKAIAKAIADIRELDVKDSIELMCEALSLLRERLDHSIEAFIEKDSVAAREIAKGDDDIDAISNQILRKVKKEMLKDIEHLKTVSKLLFLAKSIERMGDYIVNICESTVFLNTGELVELM